MKICIITICLFFSLVFVSNIEASDRGKPGYSFPPEDPSFERYREHRRRQTLDEIGGSSLDDESEITSSLGAESESSLLQREGIVSHLKVEIDKNKYELTGNFFTLDEYKAGKKGKDAGLKGIYYEPTKRQLRNREDAVSLVKLKDGERQLTIAIGKNFGVNPENKAYFFEVNYVRYGSFWTPVAAKIYRGRFSRHKNFTYRGSTLFFPMGMQSRKIEADKLLLQDIEEFAKELFEQSETVKYGVFIQYCMRIYQTLVAHTLEDYLDQNTGGCLPDIDDEKDFLDYAYREGNRQENTFSFHIESGSIFASSVQNIIKMPRFKFFKPNFKTAGVFLQYSSFGAQLHPYIVFARACGLKREWLTKGTEEEVIINEVLKLRLDYLNDPESIESIVSRFLGLSHIHRNLSSENLLRLTPDEQGEKRKPPRHLSLPIKFPEEFPDLSPSPGAESSL